MKKNPFTWCGQKLKACWQWYKSLYEGRAWYVKLLSLIASLLVAFLLYLGMVDINFLGLFGRSPGFISGLEPQISQASEIYSADGVMKYKRKFCLRRVLHRKVSLLPTYRYLHQE